jgi:hypothetical protein
MADGSQQILETTETSGWITRPLWPYLKKIFNFLCEEKNNLYIFIYFLYAKFQCFMF